MKLKTKFPGALLVSLALFVASPQDIPAKQGKEPKTIVTAKNPDPKTLPTLGVWQDDKLSPGKRLTMVSATFPNVPGFTCDSWCYESDLDFLSACDLGDGRLEIRHRLREHPHVIVVTVVTPEPGAVEFSARAELEKAGRGTLPDPLPFLNLCWQVRRAPSFASKPEPYPEFIKRCFIFTEKGRTFLDKTTRRKIPCRPADDPYNNPPWVQMYVGVWQEVPQAGPNSWADYSTDRYIMPVIGVVSRDGKYLAALANDSATVMAQAWHDCLHNNPQWLPADAPPAQRRWRLKIYAMENDMEALLERVRRDFPNALRYGPQRGDAKGASAMFLEFDAHIWTFSAKGSYEGRLDRRNLYVIRHPWLPAVTGNFGQLETTVTLPVEWQPPFALHFYAADDYVADNYRLPPDAWLGMECYQGHRFKQVLINETVVWEADVGDDTPPYFAVNITPYVQPGKPFRLALRVVDKVGTDITLPGDFMHIGATETGVKKPGDPRRFFTNVWWGDVALRERDDGKEPMKPRPRPIESAVAKRHKERFPLPPLHTPWNAPITLNLETPCPLPDNGFPVTCGVPMPFGKVRDVNRIGLQDAKGRPVPTQRQVLNRWRDGSIRWVLFDLLAKPGAAPYRLVLNTHASPSPPKQINILRKGTRVKLDTGVFVVELGGNPDRLVDRITLKATDEPIAKQVVGRMLIERDGKAQIFHPRWESVEVTAQGTIRATVELRGHLIGETEAVGRFVFRLHVYAGQTLMRVFYRVFNDTSETLKVKDLTLSVPVNLNRQRQIAWGDSDGTFQQATSPEINLMQTMADAYTVRTGDKEVASGKRAAGWLSVSDGKRAVLIAVRHFWQQFPKALKVTDEAVEVRLFASTPEIPVFEPTPGEAKRHEILLLFGTHPHILPHSQTSLLLHPPRLFSSDWFCASGGLGAAYPHTDKTFQALHEFMAKTYGDVAPERFNISFGIRHFGDRRYGDPANDYWCNNYYDAMMGFFSEYLMSGDRRWFERGEETTLHVMDIDQNHHDVKNPENVGGIHAYNSPNHTQGGYWNAMLRQGAGFATYYRLTGDPDAKEALLMLADFIMRNNRGVGSGSARDHAGPLQTLVWAYDETGDEKYLKACRRIVEDLLSGRVVDRRRGTYVEIHGNYNYRGSVPWMDVQLAEPLYLYYRHSGDLDAAQLVVGLCEAIICEDMTPGIPGDFYGYSHNPHYSKTSGYHILIAPAMLYAYDLTGDREFFTCACAAFEQTLKENTVNPVINCYWNTPTLLYFLHHEGNRFAKP